MTSLLTPPSRSLQGTGTPRPGRGTGRRTGSQDSWNRPPTPPSPHPLPHHQRSECSKNGTINPHLTTTLVSSPSPTPPLPPFTLPSSAHWEQSPDASRPPVSNLSLVTPSRRTILPTSAPLLTTPSHAPIAGNATQPGMSSSTVPTSKSSDRNTSATTPSIGSSPPRPAQRD